MRNGSGRQGHSSEGQRHAAEMYQHKDRPLGLSSPQSNSATTKTGYQQAGEQLCQTTGKLTYFLLEQDGGLTQPQPTLPLVGKETLKPVNWAGIEHLCALRSLILNTGHFTRGRESLSRQKMILIALVFFWIMKQESFHSTVLLMVWLICIHSTPSSQNQFTQP